VSRCALPLRISDGPTEVEGAEAEGAEAEAVEAVQEVQVALVLLQVLPPTEAQAVMEVMEVLAATPRLMAVWDITAALSAVEAHILISAR
jgi:hypothetical protein